MTLFGNRFFWRISVRLAFWYGLTLLLLLSAFSLFTYLFFRQGQIRDFDQHLLHERTRLLPLLEVSPHGPALREPDVLTSVAYQTEGMFGTFVRLLTADGDVVNASPNLSGRVLEVLLPATAVETSVRREWQDSRARSLYTPLTNDGGVLQGWLEVTGFEWTLQQELYGLARSMLIGILLSVVLAVFGGYLLARRALRPVSAMTEAAERIHATDLSARLPTRFGVRDELAELAETFNRMIERIESSFGRERRFTDNAAHELLTPLTTISNNVQIALRRDREPQAYRATLDAIQTDVEEMSETVQGLLLLARMDRREDLPHAPINFSELLSQHLLRFGGRFEEQNLQLHVDVQSGVWVYADVGRVGDLLNNLFDNAIKYTPAGGSVFVRVRPSGGDAHLVVADSGIGFDQNEGERLFDRFYRSNRLDVQRKPGSGLGLSIVKAIAEAYGGRVSATSKGPGSGSRFEVWLPLANSRNLSA